MSRSNRIVNAGCAGKNSIEVNNAKQGQEVESCFAQGNARIMANELSTDLPRYGMVNTRTVDMPIGLQR